MIRHIFRIRVEGEKVGPIANQNISTTRERYRQNELLFLTKPNERIIKFQSPGIIRPKHKTASWSRFARLVILDQLFREPRAVSRMSFLAFKYPK